MPTMAERFSVFAPDDKPLPPMPNASKPDVQRARSPARAPARLQKTGSDGHVRTSSGQHLPAAEPTLPSLQDLQKVLANQDAASDGTLKPPPSVAGGYSSRSSSRDRSRPGTPDIYSNLSRPATPVLHIQGQSPTTPSSPAGSGDEKAKKKHWWSKSSKKDGEAKRAVAWVAGHPHQVAYDAEGLVHGQPMPELWDNEHGDCTVFLFPRDSQHGPSFRIPSSVFAASSVLTRLVAGDASGHGPRRQLPLDGRTPGPGRHDLATPPMSPPRNGIHAASEPTLELYVPVKLSSAGTAQAPSTLDPDDRTSMEDLQALVDYRNLFAFLCGQSLIATDRRSSFFSIFMTISSLLKPLQFSSPDGSTYGDVATASFDGYVEELGLADVRQSREKTIEGIVLGERMKSVLLYNEAFTHAAGKLEDVIALKSPKFDMITSVTQTRLTRAVMDLDKRVASIQLILNDFDFPFLFSGIMSSKTSEERKDGVRFDAWKESFLGMRKFFMGHHKQKYGDWPPKAKSKKNTLETSGLNRVVLVDMYNDLASLYDLLVDRQNHTTRTIDGVNVVGGRDAPTVRGLRRVLAEYDRSSPPVKPPVPFDLPRIPTLRVSRPDFGVGDAKKDAKAAHKKLHDDEIALLLRQSSNDDTVATPFVTAFRDMEKRAAHGCNLAELEDLRIGQWIFVYVVLQALPMLACDAPGLKFAAGVEYFLCEPPRSGVPWADSNATGAGGRTWFSVGAGGNVVSLPASVVEHGAEGIYMRSHCWQMAQKWIEADPGVREALAQQQQQHHHHQHEQSPGLRKPSADGGLVPVPVPPPGDLLRPDSRTRDPSPSGRRVSSIGGSETLPPGPAAHAPAPAHRSRTPVHVVDASRTFDTILADVKQGKSKKKK